MMQRIPEPITVEQFERAPDPSGGRYELHHGELVFETYPLRPHKSLQRRLRKILEPLLEPKGYVVDTEYPYRPLPQNELWGADVACVKAGRDKATDKWLAGSPELVIEVKSRSNTKTDLENKAMTTLAGAGALEFWVVDRAARMVTVYSKAGMSVYRLAESVPLPLLKRKIRVADLLGLPR